MMGRTDSFKQARMAKFKMFTALMMFMLMMVVGIGIVDYSINSIVSDTPKIEIVKVSEVSNNLYNIDFANRDYKLNTFYLSRDIQRLKKRLSEIF